MSDSTPLVRIPRRGLSDRVRGALARGSLMLTAPAGYGKSTILEQALEDMDGTAVWVRCTPASRHADHLISRLFAAMARAIPGAADLVAERAAASPLIRPLDVIGALVADLDAVLVEPAILVIDNAEQLDGAEEACDVLTELLRSEAAHVRVAVASRRTLALEVAKLRVAGRHHDLGPGDLAFDVGECAEYLRMTTGAPPDDEEVAAIVTATEGWPLAAAALVHARGGRVQPRPLRSATQLWSFLAEEVLQPLDAVTRRSLLTSSVPELMTPALASALGLPDDFVHRVGGSALYLRPVVGTDGAVEYHPLFREFLLDRLRIETAAGEVAELHRRAGVALTEEGHHVEAVEHLLDAGDWAAVVTLLGRHGQELARSSADLVRSWVGRLPAAVRSGTTVLLVEGQLEWAAGNHTACVEMLERALAGERDPGREWHARFMLLDSLVLLGRLEEAIAVVGDLEGGATAGPVAAAAAVLAAHVLAGLGRVEEATALVERASAFPGWAAVAPLDLLRRVHIDVPAGKLEQAMTDAVASYRVVGETDPFVRSRTMVTIALVAAEQGYLDHALEWWCRMEEEAGVILQSRLASVARANQALLLSQLGRVIEAETVLTGAAPISGWSGYTHDVARAVIASARGQRDRVIEVAAGALQAVGGAMPLFRFWAVADLVPALGRVGADERAVELLAETSTLVDGVFPGAAGRMPRARLLALRAWLAAGTGEQAASDADLVSSFAEAGDAAPDLLRREWPRLEPVVADALARGIIEPHVVVRHLSKAFPDGLALVPFAGHPHPAVRRAALGPALASGHPAAAVKLAELQDDPDAAVAAAARAVAAGIALSPPPRVIGVLGGFSVRRGAWRVEEQDWGRRAAARLVRYLVTRNGVPVPEDVLFDTFWPDADPDKARRSLQVAVSSARSVLDHPGAASLIEIVEGVCRLRLAEGDVVDSEEFEAVARSALAGGRPDRRALEHARSLWTGEPLPEDRYADWAASWRERLVDRYVEVLDALIDIYERDGDDGPVIGAARELVELDAPNEPAHRRLMAAYARTGRRGRALRQYLECRRVLAELGLEPTEETSRLQARIVAGEPL